MIVEILLDTLSWICLIVGSFFAVVGGLGLLRLPDLFCRMHGAGVTDTMGAGMILAGLMFQSGLSLTTVKILTILFFLLVTSPTATHALARAALGHGLNPQGSDPGDAPSNR